MIYYNAESNVIILLGSRYVQEGEYIVKYSNDWWGLPNRSHFKECLLDDNFEYIGKL